MTIEEKRKATREFNRIIDNLKSNKIFNIFFSDLDDKNKKKTIISIENFEEDETKKAETTRDNKNGERRITFNSSIYYDLKQSFLKLCNKKDLNETDVININYFVHEYLHNKQIFLFTLNRFNYNLSEGLTEIISQRYTNKFLEAFCGNNIKYKKIDSSPIHRDIVYVIKPLLREFKTEKIYDDMENMLGVINHNNIRGEFVGIMNKYDKTLSGLTMLGLKRKLDYK